MSIADELLELQANATALDTTRTDIRSALVAKGVSASDHDFADFATDIASIVAAFSYPDGIKLNSGTSGYFPTGIKLDGTVECEFEYEVNQRKTYGPHMLSGSSYFMPFVVNTSGSKLRTTFSGTQTDNDITPITGKIHIKTDFANGKVVCNNTEYSVTIPSSTSTDTKDAVIGNYGGSPGTDYSLVGIIYWMKIWKNGTLVKDYIPVKNNATNALGLYDKVSETVSEYSKQTYAEAYYEV